MLRIKSKRNNFRRCGVAHSDQWVEHPEGRFTAGEIAILKAEPMLQVEMVVPEEISDGRDIDKSEKDHDVASAQSNAVEPAVKKTDKAGKKGR